jgi:catecholate siderophore receptor
MNKNFFVKSKTITIICGVSILTNSIAGDINLKGIDVTAPIQNYFNSYSGTATKTNTQLINLPQTVNVINQEQIKDQQVNGLAESILYTPGIDLDQGEGNRDAFILRGNKTTSDIFLDGIRDDAQYYRDLYNIERVDVLMGANGILFGKGGSGGIVNRVSKQAQFENFNNYSLQFGSFDSKRATLDINKKLSDRLAVRINIMADKSDSFVSGVSGEKQGINPVFTYLVDDLTTIKFGREYFHDQRIGYRGVPSKNGRPYNGNRDTFYGVASLSRNEVTVNSTFFNIEHNFSENINFKNSTRYTDYDKWYQNVYADDLPNVVGVVNDEFKLSGYYDNTQRQNFFNQTDITWNFDFAGFEHTLLTGLEIGNQDNRRYRLTSNPEDNVSIHTPQGSGVWSFNNYNRDKVSDIRYTSIYVQDQIKIDDKNQIVLGLRKDHYDTDFNIIKSENNNTPDGTKFKIKDNMLSSRIGYIFKPQENLSYYVSYSNAYQPRNGDQLDSINNRNVQEDPEKFINYEIGTKIAINEKLFATFAMYQLERERMQITDPNTPGQDNNILVDGQRSRGFELTLNGNLTDRLNILAGYNYVDAELTKDQANIEQGTSLGNVARHNFSMWNKFEIDSIWSAALGVIGKGEMYAETPTSTTSVTIPGWVRFDAALFAKIDEKTRLQLNVENLLDKTYYSSAHNVNNIMVGMPLIARVTLIQDF